MTDRIEPRASGALGVAREGTRTGGPGLDSVADLLERYAVDTAVVAPAGLAARIMLAVEAEPAPTPMRLFAIALVGAQPGLALAALHQTWRLAVGGSRTSRVIRAQAIALVLLMVFSAAALGAAGAALMTTLLRDQGPAPSVTVPLPPDGSPGPSTTPAVADTTSSPGSTIGPFGTDSELLPSGPSTSTEPAGPDGTAGPTEAPGHPDGTPGATKQPAGETHRAGGPDPTGTPKPPKATEPPEPQTTPHPTRTPRPTDPPDTHEPTEPPEETDEPEPTETDEGDGDGDGGDGDGGGNDGDSQPEPTDGGRGDGDGWMIIFAWWLW